MKAKNDHTKLIMQLLKDHNKETQLLQEKVMSVRGETYNICTLAVLNANPHVSQNDVDLQSALSAYGQMCSFNIHAYPEASWQHLEGAPEEGVFTFFHQSGFSALQYELGNAMRGLNTYWDATEDITAFTTDLNVYHDYLLESRDTGVVPHDGSFQDCRQALKRHYKRHVSKISMITKNVLILDTFLFHNYDVNN